MNIRHFIISVLVVAAIVGGVLYFSHEPATQNENLGGKIMATTTTAIPSSRTIEYNFFASSTLAVPDATTTSAISSNMTGYYDETNGRWDDGTLVIAGADAVTIEFRREDDYVTANTGTTTFTIQVTEDKVTWHDYTKLNSATSSTPTNVSSYVMWAATSSVLLSMDLAKDNIYAIRCTVVELANGKHFCKAYAVWK